MKAIKISDVAPVDKSHETIFRGKVTIQPIFGAPGKAQEGISVGVVNFSPGAVNVFHTHAMDQVLYVTEGIGIVATEKEEIKVTPGTVIVIPAGEKHWHGATKDSAFSHLAITLPGETKW